MLSNEEILEYKLKKQIVIHPFVKENLGTNSYDLTLGEYYYREQKPVPFRSAVGCPDLYNIYDKKQVSTVWGKPRKAKLAKDELDPLDCVNIKPTDKIIVLAPHETILAHTEEFAGGSIFITSMMKARSSFGRNFIEVCKCAGMGDVGYYNRWTMEITNNSRYYHIPLVVSRRICQLVFFKTGFSFAYSDSGKYQIEENLEDLIKNWKPEMMLPKLYNDRELHEAK